MHIISRGMNEKLAIGDNVFVTVLEIQHDFVRLGVADSLDARDYEEHVIHFDAAELEEELQPH